MIIYNKSDLEMYRFMNFFSDNIYDGFDYFNHCELFSDGSRFLVAILNDKVLGVLKYKCCNVVNGSYVSMGDNIKSYIHIKYVEAHKDYNDIKVCENLINNLMLYIDEAGIGSIEGIKIDDRCLKYSDYFNFIVEKRPKKLNIYGIEK